MESNTLLTVTHDALLRFLDLSDGPVGEGRGRMGDGALHSLTTVIPSNATS